MTTPDSNNPTTTNVHVINEVNVENSTDQILIVNAVFNQKIFRGVLVADDPGSQVGVNVDRACSRSTWPPISQSNASCDLKTIPCSSDRYTYKYDGQPSSLNVFQPDATRRSHRTTPAPQLSRILRPRRFVCRECKKAYHVQENGNEMSSNVLKQSSCPEINSRDKFDATLIPPTIKLVSPSIIPKLNEEIASNCHDSDTQSEDSYIRPKLRTEDSSHNLRNQILFKKRGLSAVEPSHENKVVRKAKRCKRTTVSGSKSKEDIRSSSIDKHILSSQSDSSIEKSKQRSNNGIPVPSNPKKPARKNLIEAQYKSVISPSRFLPDRSAKPAFSISGALIIPSHKRPPGSTSSPFKSKTTSLSSIESKSGIPTKSTRSRTAKSRTKDLDSSSFVNTLTSDKSESVAISDKNSLSQSSICNHHSADETNSEVESTATAVSAPQETTCEPVDCLPRPSSAEHCPPAKLKTVDYEKPKNRWMREVRARKSPDGKITLSNASAKNESDQHTVMPVESVSVSKNHASLKTDSIGCESIVNMASSKNEEPQPGVTGNPSANDTDHQDIVDSDKSSGQSRSSSLGLPVLRIKLKANSASSNNSSESNSQQPQYEVVVNQSLEPTTNALSPCSSTTGRKHLPPPTDLTTTSELGPPVERCCLASGTSFALGDLVWGKLSGWPYWPAQIKSIFHTSPVDAATDINLPPLDQTTVKKDSFTACLHWFAWHQVSFIPCDKLYHFSHHCKRFDNKKKKGTFREAVKEARAIASSSSGEKTDKQSPICDIPNPSSPDPKLDCQSSPAKPIPLDAVSNSPTLSSQLPFLSTKPIRGQSRARGGRRSTSTRRPKQPINSSTSVFDFESELSTTTTVPVLTCKRGSRGGVRANHHSLAKRRATRYVSTISRPGQDGSLRIVLSTKSSNDPKPKKTMPRNSKKQSNCLDESVVVNEPSAPVEGVNVMDVTVDVGGHQNCNYDEPSDEILSQFPQVLPDIKPTGMLPDIPTFSEDEDDEECGGNLIIDPDVLRTGVVSQAPPIPTFNDLLAHPGQNPFDQQAFGGNVRYSLANSGGDPHYVATSNQIDRRGLDQAPSSVVEPMTGLVVSKFSADRPFR